MAGKIITALTGASGGELAATSVMAGMASAGTQARKFTVTQIAGILNLGSLAGALSSTGAFTLNLNTTAATNVTLPTSGTLATLAGAEALTNKTLTAPVINLTITTDNTTARTLALADNGTYIRMTSGSANTVTIPLNASVAFAIGAQISLIQAGAGVTTIVATGGVTLNCAHTLVARTQYSMMTLIKVASDTWDLAGDLA